MTKERLVALSAKNLSKFGTWYLSDDPNKLHIEIKDMRAVLK